MRASRVLVSAVVVAVVTTSLTGLSAAAAPPTRPAAPPAATAQPTAAASATVPTAGTSRSIGTLVTGERVFARTQSGRTSYGVPAVRTGPGAVHRSVSMGDRAYVIPAVATPYLNRQLDLSLFDVTALTPATAGRTDVLISHSGATPALPGVTVTRDEAGVAEGYLTPASAKTFGAALAAQWVKDQRSGTTGGGLFQRVTRVAATSAAPPVVTPNFPMKTLIFDVTGPDGKPVAFSSGLVLNVDDARKYMGWVPVERGQGRISVPTGSYGGTFDFIDITAAGDLLVRQLALPTVRVTSSNQRVSVDFRRATAHPSVRTPRATSGGELDVTYSRTDAAGYGGIGAGMSAPYPSTDFAVAPIGPARLGTQSVTTDYHLEGTGTRSPYLYDVTFSDPDIRADQSRVVRAADIGTVEESFGVDQPDPLTLLGRFPVASAEFFAFFSLWEVPAPGKRTSYLAAEATTAWMDVSYGNAMAEVDPDLIESHRAVLPGTTTREVWRTGPRGAGFPRNDAGAVWGMCWACRGDGGLFLAFSPATDATPHHAGYLFGSPDGTPVAHMRIETEDGRVVVDEDDVLGARFDGVSGATGYRASLDVDRSWTGATTSTRTRTEVSFGSRTAAPAPGSWDCPVGDACTVLDVLAARLSYPGGLDASVEAGTVRFRVDAARIQGAEPAAVNGATLSLRPAGHAWTTVKLSRVGAGKYAADVDLPASLTGSTVDVRYGATDVDGRSFTQTVHKAFRVKSAGTAGAAALSASAGEAAAAAFTRSAPRASCGNAEEGAFRCLSLWRPGAGAGRLAPRSTTTAELPEYGYGPADIRSAYQLDTSKGAGQTVAVVVAYDNPKAEADLAVYRKAFGLPPCTTANGCFRKVNQRGGSTPPEGDPGWGLETALDIQAVSAACPRCKILLVEADAASFEDIGAAVNRAVTMGAKIVSNSYGADEFGSARDYARRFYTHPGVAQVVSSGNWGFTTASFPAVWPDAIAVGGTRLTRPKGVWTERAWSSGSSGCSAWFAKPAWQKDPHCTMRTTSDLSAVGDPETGFAVYDTYGLGPDNGWIVVGGTSLAAPLVAGMIGLAGNAAKLDSAKYIYDHRSGLHDVVGGTNGFCGGDYLCRAKVGYDGPTGLGSPRGTSAL